MFLLSLSKIKRYTSHMLSNGFELGTCKYSCNGQRITAKFPENCCVFATDESLTRYYLCDFYGNVFLSHRNSSRNRSTMELCHIVTDHNSSSLPGIFLWLDHYLTRLESGVCGVRPLRTLDPGPTRGWYISLFPNRGHSSHSGEITNTAPREYVCNVVNGVQVTASVVHVGTLESDR